MARPGVRARGEQSAESESGAHGAQSTRGRRGIPGAARTSLRRDAAVLAVAALVFRLGVFLSPAQVGFDDGQFACSVLAMRAGSLPFRQVFSSQGPLFLPLAWLGDLVTFRTLDSPRTVAVVAGVVVTALVYRIGREITSRPRAVVAAALAGSSGSVLWTTGPLTSDGIALAFSCATVLGALVYRRGPSTRLAVGLAVLGAAAFSVKSLQSLPAILTAALVVVVGRRARDALAAASAGVATAVLVAMPWGLHNVIEQSVLYHSDKAGAHAPLSNAWKTLSTLAARDVPLLAVAAVAVVTTAVVWARRTPHREPAAPPDSRPSPRTDSRWRGFGRLERVGDHLMSGAAPVAVWAVLAAAMLLEEAPMWRNHVAHLVAPLALLVVLAPVRWTVVATAAALCAPWQVYALRGVLFPHDYTGREASVERVLRALPPGAEAISDDPGLVWRAGRRPPTMFVDVSILRITSSRRNLRITENDVVRGAAAPVVCAVVQWSSVRFASFRTLGPRLEGMGYQPEVTAAGSPRLMWVRTDCRPPR